MLTRSRVRRTLTVILRSSTLTCLIWIILFLCVVLDVRLEFPSSPVLEFPSPDLDRVPSPPGPGDESDEDDADGGDVQMYDSYW